LHRDLYLRIAPELYLKRLLVAGFEKVFELNRNFRNEGIDTTHNPEFTMLEVYQAYVDGQAMMKFTENLFAHLAQAIHGHTKITYQGQELELAPPWRRLGYIDAVKEQTGTDVWNQTPAQLAEICRKHGLEAPDDAGKAELVEFLFENLVEPKLIQPTFIVDFPIELSPLAKQKAGAPEFADRFEPYIAGHEYANGFSELNDPVEQRKRFEQQVEMRTQGDDEAQMMDEDYVRALEYGMPPAGGLGVGIDRLVMLLTDSASIRDVILFPQLRRILITPEEEEVQEEEPGQEFDPI
jgi:lysyl-tRNA synthetase class 2